MNSTFNAFRELQQRWRETGIVPQTNVKELWETYNLHVENFYNYIKINKEPARPRPQTQLRDQGTASAKRPRHSCSNPR